MKRGFVTALALAALAAGSCTPVSAQTGGTTPCSSFGGLKSDAEKKALAVRTAIEHKVERKQICTLVQRFATAEETVVKFLEHNKSWCGIPQEAINAAKSNHERTLKFRTMACAEAPAARPRAPSLSDAIGTPTVDTGENTRTGRGTLDSLTGNPLAK